MEVQQLLQALKNNKIKLIDLNKGLTNHNYYFEYENQAYVLRVPPKDSHTIVDRSNEQVAINLLKSYDIDVPIIYYDELGYKITKYIPNTKTYSECQQEDKIEQVALMMKKLHGLALKSNKSFHPIQKFYQYRNHTTIADDLKDIDKIINELESYLKDSILCHNDWVDGNILFDDNRMYLIDFEYAGDNHPYFDIASFLSENEIYDSNLRKRFYDTYFNDYNQETIVSVELFEKFADALWYYWAMMMYEKRQQSIYLEIANSKKQAYYNL